MSDAQISTLFIIWSVTSFVLEVPSGAWADTVDRRRLLVLSAVIYAAGFASWLALPGYAGFALGFVLWGVSGSIMSGTFESLLYDELVVRGREDDYPGLIGLAQSSALVANLLAAGIAVPLMALGGYQLVGWVVGGARRRPGRARRDPPGLGRRPAARRCGRGGADRARPGPLPGDAAGRGPRGDRLGPGPAGRRDRRRAGRVHGVRRVLPARRRASTASRPSGCRS